MPLRIWITQLLLLITLVVTILTWVYFIAIQRPNSASFELLLVPGDSDSRLTLLADRQSYITGKQLLPAGQSADCKLFPDPNDYRNVPWDVREVEEPVIVGDQEYRWETQVDITGNSHGGHYCLQVDDLWGDRQVVVSDPIEAPVWPVSSRLTGHNLVVSLMLAPGTRVQKAADVGYLVPRDPVFVETCDPIYPLEDNSFRYFYETISLDRVDQTFEQQPEGVQLDISIPRGLINEFQLPEQLCHHLEITVASVSNFIIHHD